MRRRRHALDLRVALLHACRTPSILLLVLTILIIMSPLQSVISSSTEQSVQAPTVTAQSTPSVSTTTFGLGGDYFVVARASSDGGRTWVSGNSSFSYVTSATHSLAWGFIDQVGTFDANGDAYVGTINAYTNRSDNFPTVNYLFKSTDNGYTWVLTGPFLKLSDNLLYYDHGIMVHPCASLPDAERDFPAVIADPHSTSPYRNNVYVLVRDGAQLSPTECAYGTAFERSTDGGKTWGSGTWFADTQIGFVSDDRGMSVSPDGTVLLAGVGGSCFFLSNCLSRNCLTTENNVGIVLKSVDGGASFSQPICAVDDPHTGLDGVEVAAASANTIYVLFLGDNETVAPNVFHLYSKVSFDGGVNWSANARVDDVSSPDYQHVISAGGPYMWDVSLSPQTGRLDVAWFDGRNQGGEPGGACGSACGATLADIYYSYSYDGLSWANNIRVTPQGPYYMCTQSSNTCTSNGNDFMWITSSYLHGSDRAYIVASIGNSTRVESGRLFTRFVTIIFPPPAASLSVSGFFTDPSLNPLALDNSSNPMVTSVLARGIVQSSNPGQVLAWVNVTNTGSVPLQSLILNETLPTDWTVSPAWMRGKGAAHVYFANSTSLGANLEITQQLSITVSPGNPEAVSLVIANFTATMIGHPLLPGETVLLSEKLTYGLVKTSQSSTSYPRNYSDTTTVVAWAGPSYIGIEASATGSGLFTAFAKPTGDATES